MSVVRPASHCPGVRGADPAARQRPGRLLAAPRAAARAAAACAVSPRYVARRAARGRSSPSRSPRSRSCAAPGGTSLVHAACDLPGGLRARPGAHRGGVHRPEHMYLPDSITLGGTLFGLATPALRGLDLADALIGAAVGLLGVWLPFIVGYRASAGARGMGLGDAKLVMLAGAWFGWPGAAFALFAGRDSGHHRRDRRSPRAGQDRRAGSRARGPRRAPARRRTRATPRPARPSRTTRSPPRPEEGVMAARMPFGPFLCLAIIEWMLGWRLDPRPLRVSGLAVTGGGGRRAAFCGSPLRERRQRFSTGT